MGVGAGGAAAIGGGLAATGAIGGSLISASGAQSAAKQAADAARQSALLQQIRYDTTRGDLTPYTVTGQSMLGPLSQYFGATQGVLDTAFGNAQGAIPKIPDQATLLNYPGFQFNLDTGLKALQAQETARGQGLSGNADKAAMNFGTGLANQYASTYFNQGQTQYSDQVQQLQNQIALRNAVYNQISGPASLGENAAAQVGNNGATLATNAGNALQAAGTAQAAGTVGAANALGNGLSKAGDIAGQAYQAYNWLNQPQNNPNNSAYYGSPYSYNPSSSGYSGDISSTGGQALQDMGFVTPLSTP